MKIVLLHAFPVDERMWEPQRDLLADHDVFAPRLYGFGNSMEAWAQEVLAATGADDMVLVGASMGGYAALAIARRAPERVRGMLLEGSRPDADSDERRRARADTIRLIQEEGPAALWATMRPRLLTDAADLGVVSRAKAMRTEQDPLGLVHAVEAIRDRDDLTGVAQGLEVPFLAVAGSDDPFVSAAELRDLVGAERVAEVERAGHLPSFERPDAFNPLLDEFLRRVAER